MTAGFRPYEGAEFTLDGRWHRVHEFNAMDGSLTLVDAEGLLTTLSIEALVDHPRLGLPGQAKAPIDLVRLLPEHERTLVLRRMGHVNEVQTGYRSGEAAHALPGEPKPEYDPSTQFLGDRYAAKAKELDNEFARQLGEAMSVSTMRRLAKQMQTGVAFEGAVDGRKRRRSPGRYGMPEVVEEIVRDVVEAQRGRSNMTRSGLWREVKRRTWHRLGKDWMKENLPSESTFRRYLADHWTPSELTGKARTRASATDAPTGGFSTSVPTRPGELVFMDTNSLDVLLKGTGIEDTVRGSLIVGLDAYSRSVCAVRVVEQAEKDIDISFAITDLGRPKQMLPGWPEEARWPFVGLPEALMPVTGAANEELGVSGMPFVHPEALGLDHGNAYKSHKTRQIATRYGIDLLPARVRTGSDKAYVERFFGALRSMLLEHLDGYRGSDTSERGANVDNEVQWTAQRLEDLISKWVVLVWQTHVMEDVKPPWCPEGEWSPNALYLHGISTTGVVPRLMTAEDYYGVLDTAQVRVKSRGVKILGLWYDNDPDSDDPVLEGRRNQPSGNVTKKWLVHYDRRDLRRVYFVDEDGDRHLLRWRGASGEFPCFSERHVQALHRRVKADGLILDDDALAEVLITQILPQPDGEGGARAAGKQANKATSKAARDEQLADQDATKFAIPTTHTPHDATVVTAVEEKRRQRREAFGADDVAPAPRLGANRTSILGNLALTPKDNQ